MINLLIAIAVAIVIWLIIWLLLKLKSKLLSSIIVALLFLVFVIYAQIKANEAVKQQVIAEQNMILAREQRAAAVRQVEKLEVVQAELEACRGE